MTHTGLIRVGISTETHCSQERPRETCGERHSWLMEQSDACMDQGSLGPHPSSWRLTCQASLWRPLHLPTPCPPTGSFPSGSDNKESSRNAKGPGSPLGPEDPLEKGMVTHSSIRPWSIPGTAELGRLPSMMSQRARQD